MVNNIDEAVWTLTLAVRVPPDLDVGSLVNQMAKGHCCAADLAVSSPEAMTVSFHYLANQQPVPSQAFYQVAADIEACRAQILSSKASGSAIIE